MKLKPEKNSGLNGIRALDLCDTGAVLYQLSYQANWELVTLWVRNIPVEGEYCKWLYERWCFWTAAERYEEKFDHRSYAYNLSSCENKFYQSFLRSSNMWSFYIRLHDKVIFRGYSLIRLGRGVQPNLENCDQNRSENLTLWGCTKPIYVDHIENALVRDTSMEIERTHCYGRKYLIGWPVILTSTFRAGEDGLDNIRSKH